jgi:CRISPR/Cas system-associated protein endoribonuclease Cas2
VIVEFKLPADKEEERRARKKRFREALARTNPILSLQQDRATKMLKERESSTERERLMEGLVDRRNELMERLSTERNSVKNEFINALNRFESRKKKS